MPVQIQGPMRFKALTFARSTSGPDRARLLGGFLTTASTPFSTSNAQFHHSSGESIRLPPLLHLKTRRYAFNINCALFVRFSSEPYAEVHYGASCGMLKLWAGLNCVRIVVEPNSLYPSANIQGRFGGNMGEARCSTRHSSRRMIQFSKKREQNPAV